MPEQPQPEAEQPVRSPSSGVNDTVGCGVLLGIGLHLAVGVLLTNVVAVFPLAEFEMAFLACGVVQLIYMVPAMILAKIRRQRSLLKGLAIVTAVTFLVNAACAGLVMATFSVH